MRMMSYVFFKKRKLWTQSQTCTREKQCKDSQGEDDHVTEIMHLQAEEHKGLLETRKGKEGCSARAIRDSTVVQTS